VREGEEEADAGRGSRSEREADAFGGYRGEGESGVT
jgi:hypothetical protein